MRLPSLATSFVGRSEELTRLHTLFDDGAPLVTLFGAGGSGKTRLALRYGEQLWGHEAVFCDLCLAATPGDIAAAVARALAIDLASDRDLDATMAHIGRVIAARQRLLVIVDNAEHVVDAAAAAVAQFQAAAPEACFLVTSRELLALPGEVAFEVGPLGADAVQLFVDRARLIRPDYVLVDAELPVVAELVRRLDGLPLAIELAAARTGVLRPVDVLDHLRDSLDVLSGRTRGTPDRHHTLRAAIEWSWTLLSAAEKAALAQASVFPGSFSLATAGAVIDLPASEAQTPLIDLLESLRAKSLVRAFELPRVGIRFALYDSIRAFAAEQLDPGAAVAARTRLSAHFVRIATESIDVGARDLTARDVRLEPDVDSCLYAHECALASIPPRADDALVLAIGLERVLRAQGAEPTLLALIRSAEQAGVDLDPAIHARALVVRAEASTVVTSLRVGRGDLETALALATQAGDELSQGRALGAIAFLESVAHGAEQAATLFEQALAIQRRIGDVAGEARTLIRFGYAEFVKRRVDPARAHIEPGVARAREVGDVGLEVIGVRCLGYMRFMRAELAEAVGDFERAIELGQQTGSAFRPAMFAQNLALAYQEMGRFGEAETLYREAIAEQQRAASRGRLGRTHAYYATLLHETGDLDAADQHYLAGIEHLRAAPRSVELIFQFCRLFRAALLAATDRLAEAETTMAEVEALAAVRGESAVLDCAALCRGHIELGRARAALAAGDRAAAAAHRSAAIARLDAPAPEQERFDDMRLARRLLERAVRALPETVLLIDADGRWFCLHDQDRVELARHRRLHGLVVALARARLARPPRALSVDELFAAAWPGERAVATAIANRVRVSIAALRELGLRDLLVRRDGGYALDPDIEVLLVRGDSGS